MWDNISILLWPEKKVKKEKKSRVYNYLVCERTWQYVANMKYLEQLNFVNGQAPQSSKGNLTMGIKEMVKIDPSWMTDLHKLFDKLCPDAWLCYGLVHNHHHLLVEWCYYNCFRY